MSLCDEVTTYLQGLGLGTLGTNLFYSQEPDQPNVCTVVRDYGGMDGEYTHDIPGVAYERPRFQVACRGEPQDYDGPRARARAVYLALMIVKNTFLTASDGEQVWYREIVPLQSPFELRRDLKERVIIGFNCQVVKEPS
jgi:hypothetical protein